MYVRVLNWTAATAMSLVLAALAGCSAPEPDYAAPPPPPEASYGHAPVDLAGAPVSAPPAQNGLAGGPADAAPAIVSMAPIPNPEDLPPAERHRIYGTRYDRDGAPRREDGPTRTADRPYADAAARPSPVKAAPARPAVVATAPVTEKPVALTPAAQPLDPKLAKLQTALAPQVAAATLTVGAPLNQRLEGPVVLTLPMDLFDKIRAEAAKLGLGRAARVSEVSATLTGQGYEITPNGPQTARLKTGEAASFQWQVKPRAGELGPLRTQIDAVLRGQRTPMTFPLGTITKAAPVVETPVTRGLGGLNLGVVDIPGLGRMRGETAVGGGLLLLALILLVAIARNASLAEERARIRRKARRAAEEAETATEPTPTTAARPVRAKSGDSTASETAAEQKPDKT